MGSVAVFHLMFMILERERPSVSQFSLATVQAAIIFLVMNARTSATWLILAVGLFWAALWGARWLRLTPFSLKDKGPAWWPVGFLVLILAGMHFHQQVVQDSAFRDGRAYGGHVFWHNLVTALHNNPQRTERFGIPAEYPTYDDQVSYFSFNREIASRGEDRSVYLVGNTDWVYRTSSPDLDFRWAAYDQVLHDVFLRTVASDLGYAIQSFAVWQPISILGIAFGSDFLRSRAVLIGGAALSVALGLFLAILRVRLRPALLVLMLLATTIGSALPALSAAAAELRTVEIFYTLLLDAVLVVSVLAAIPARLVLAKFFHRETA